MRTFASERHYQLSEAVVEMAHRFGRSNHLGGIAYFNGGKAGGKPTAYWDRAATRQARALRRLTNALRDLDTKEI